MSKDKLTELFPWKPSSMSLSCERVREVASCCCSNVSIRLPQSGKVTLLPAATLREIEKNLKQNTVVVKKEEPEVFVKDRSKKHEPGSLKISTLSRRTCLEDGLGDVCIKMEDSKLCSSISKFKQKSSSRSSSPNIFSTFSSSSSFMSSINNPKTNKNLYSASHDTMNEHHSSKKSFGDHNRHSEFNHFNRQQFHPSSSSHISEGGSSSSFTKHSSFSKEGRSGTASNSSRKSKKEEGESTWMNTLMFSDDSSSSPFHTSICFVSFVSLMLFRPFVTHRIYLFSW